MTDQGLMVDDGTCESCWLENCRLCTKPSESYGDGEIALHCCCDEGCHIGYAGLDQIGDP